MGNNVPEIVGKAGIATSEFWVIILTLVGGFLTHAFGHDWGISENAQNIATLVTAVVAAVYALSRSWVKTGTHKAIALAAGGVRDRFTVIDDYQSGEKHILDSLTGDVFTLEMTKPSFPTSGTAKAEANTEAKLAKLYENQAPSYGDQPNTESQWVAPSSTEQPA